VIRLLEPHEAGFTGEWRMERFGLLGTRSIFFLGYISMGSALLGDFERAWPLIAEMNEVARQSGRPIDRYAAAFHESLVHIVAGPDQAFEDRLRATIEDCRIKAPAPFYTFLLARLGHIRLLRRDPAGASEILGETIARAERSDMPHTRRYAGAVRACAEGQLNGPEALPALAAALEDSRDGRFPWTEVLVLRAMADVSEPAEGLDLLDVAEAVAVAWGYRPEQARICAARAEIAEQLDKKIARRALEQARTLFTEVGLEREALALAEGAAP